MILKDGNDLEVMYGVLDRSMVLLRIPANKGPTEQIAKLTKNELQALGEHFLKAAKSAEERIERGDIVE